MVSGDYWVGSICLLTTGVYLLFLVGSSETRRKKEAKFEFLYVRFVGFVFNETGDV